MLQVPRDEGKRDLVEPALPIDRRPLQPDLLDLVVLATPSTLPLTHPSLPPSTPKPSYTLLTHPPAFQTYIIVPGAGLRVLNNTHNIPWSVYVGTAGMPGMTAYSAWKEYADVKPVSGRFVFRQGRTSTYIINRATSSSSRPVLALWDREYLSICPTTRNPSLHTPLS